MTKVWKIHKVLYITYIYIFPKTIIKLRVNKSIFLTSQFPDQSWVFWGHFILLMFQWRSNILISLYPSSFSVADEEKLDERAKLSVAAKRSLFRVSCWLLEIKSWLQMQSSKTCSLNKRYKYELYLMLVLDSVYVIDQDKVVLIIWNKNSQKNKYTFPNHFTKDVYTLLLKLNAANSSFIIFFFLLLNFALKDVVLLQVLGGPFCDDTTSIVCM